MKSNLDELISIHASKGEGDRFQKQLGNFIKDRPDLTTMVETGAGISTLFMAKNMGPETKLYSIDTGPWCEFIVEHPNYKFIKERSIDAILNLYFEVGPFDLVLTDGNHSCKYQTYEYNVLWEFLKPSGTMINDDTTWGGHEAFNKFIQERGITPFQMGGAWCVTKPKEYGFCPAARAKEVHEFWLEKAEAAQNRFYALGGQPDTIFVD